LVVVARASAAGGIDEHELEAFVTGPGEGVLYMPGQWHLGLTSLDQPARFQMAMWTGELADTEIRNLAIPATVFAE
jgi:ureidoglycolate lyase